MAVLVDNSLVIIKDQTPAQLLWEIGDRFKTNNFIVIEYPERMYARVTIVIDVLTNGYKAVNIYEERGVISPDSVGRATKMGRIKIERKRVLNDD